MHIRRWTISWLLAATAWSCAGSATGVDSNPGTDVAAIDVAPSSFTLVVGAEAPFQASVRDASGQLLPDVPVVWSVKDTTIARISSSGVVSARTVGNTEVAASANGVSAIATITVQLPPVVSVLVQPVTQTLVLGQSTTLTATPRDANGAPLTGRVVTWTSSDDAVATISQNGELTTHATGTATITAASEGVSGSATVVVTPVPVGSVSVLPTSATMTTGQSVTLGATVADATGRVVTDRAVTWASSDLHVAVVSATGVVTGVAPGTATISATSEGKTGTSAVTVVAPAIASVAIQPTSTSMLVGSSTTLTATVKDVSGAVVTNAAVVWSSSNPSVATVTASGVVSGAGVGTAIITATSGAKAGTAVVTVQPVAAPVASVTLQPTSVTLAPGETAPLQATTKSANGTVLTGRVVTFSSSNASVARVSSDGVVTGVAYGTATITATSEGQSATATITVQPPVAYVVVSPNVVFVRKNSTVQLSATAYDAADHGLSGRAVTWSSSDDRVATVSTTGLVTAKKQGVVTISATVEGKTGTAQMVVTN